MRYASVVQDAAYGTLLRGPRRALHARIAETLESGFPEIAESQPELLTRHCTEAGLIEKAARQCGKAGRRSLERATGLTALVGREEETELLQRRWARAKTGQGQVVLLSGEGRHW
jgi:predicted ATPase